jgi:hypothetical protein
VSAGHVHVMRGLLDVSAGHVDVMRGHVAP